MTKELTAPHPSPPRVGEGIKAPFAICPTMRLWISSAYRLTRPHFAAAVRFVKFRVTHKKIYSCCSEWQYIDPSLLLSPHREREKMPFAIRITIRSWNRRTRNKRGRLRLSPCLGLLTAQTAQRSLRNGRFTPVKIRSARAVQGDT